MREILFRGKRIDNGDFIEGHLYGIWDKKYILWGQTNHVPNGEEVIPETVGQFTGLLDKSGDKIFEGDIVKCHAMQTTEVVIVEDIRNIPVRFKWVDIYEGSTIEIIGNIHDNPELLKETK